MLIVYFFLTTPLVLIFILASIPEPIKIEPNIISRIFFLVLVFGLWSILYYYVNPVFKNLKYKTIILVLAFLASAIFLIISLNF